MKKGFTLIELLAVIVILAIIALIATPIVLNIIKDASESAAKESATAYIKAVEQGYVSKLTKNEKIENGDYTIPALDELGIKVKGDKPSGDDDYVTIQEGKVTDYSLTIKGYNIYYQNGDMMVDSSQENSCTGKGLLDHTVTFMVDGKPYEIVSVKSGNIVKVPSSIPTSDTSVFTHWSIEGKTLSIPFIPTEDTSVEAVFSPLLDEFYRMNNISRIDYPIIYIILRGNSVVMLIGKQDDLYLWSGGGEYYISARATEWYRATHTDNDFNNVSKGDPNAIMKILVEDNVKTGSINKFSVNYRVYDNTIVYTNSGNYFEQLGTWFVYGEEYIN